MHIPRRSVLAVFGLGFIASGADAQSIKRVEIVSTFTPDEMRSSERAFMDRLNQLGWVDGKNVRVRVNSASSRPDQLKKVADEVVARTPDLIVAQGTPVLRPIRDATSKIPIVFLLVADPVRGGLVSELARPGGNATGFTNYEYDIATKWLELLKTAAPHIEQVFVLVNPNNPTWTSYVAFIDRQATSIAVRVGLIHVESPDDSRLASGLSSSSGRSGLIVLPDGLLYVMRKNIIASAQDNKVPAIYGFSSYTDDGGLMSYGLDHVELFKEVATYVHRILSGDKPGELPVQAPTRFQLIVNARAAAKIGLDLPALLLARADKVIE